MIIYPAIDLLGGLVVRLRQGRASEQNAYSNDPVSVASRWESEGASWLHVVDLDAALGNPGDANRNTLRQVRASVRISIQFGGGLRDLDAVTRAFELGADRIVIGTMAIEHPSVLSNVVDQFGGDRVSVAIDTRRGRVATHGWRSVSNLRGIDFGKRMRDLGIARAVVTDISRDGMLGGLDAKNIAEIARQCSLRVIASGGIGSLDDLRRLRQFESAGIEGTIVGQALYTGAFTLREAIQVALPC